MNDQALIHPEHVNGRRLWIDPAMQDIIHKIRFGDSTRGWEGDESLAVFWNDTLKCFELMRFEPSELVEDYSLVARLKPGARFDERILDELVARDMHRKDRYFSLAEQVERHNQAIDDAHQARMEEMIAEEVAPRLRRSLIKEDMI